MKEKPKDKQSCRQPVALPDESAIFARSLYHARERQDPSYAADLLHGFLSAIEQGKALPPAVAEYLYSGIRAYLIDGTPLEKALLLTAPASRPEGTHARSPIWAVATLYLYVKRDGMNKTRAKEKLEDDHHIPQRNIERYDSELNLIREMDVQALEQLAADNWRHPATK